MLAKRPIVALTACRRDIDGVPFHAVGDKYLTAVADAAGAMPLLLPAMSEDLDIGRVIASIDGLLVTGSPSNVEPRHYGGETARSGTLADPARDATTLPLIRAAVAARLPLFAICRGMQELNVALGGTLHQHLHELPGRRDHRAPAGQPFAVRYAPAHPVALRRDGQIAALARAAGLDWGGQTVNSAHAQGIDRLAPGLVVEAEADDGVIEAVRVADATGFAIGIQWHPEYRATEYPLSSTVFAAFGAACRTRLISRL
ncbi:MAG: gamma-glutamyl-gamma-aminobutyrate hydrolase family protein [Alphaproteobacteria bacterium]|nr:gamma-glutamyl-gamma-aminobutyrate hydrolase family protein [Alphaproteobacteria bacterium]